jgi:hypothetical protein
VVGVTGFGQVYSKGHDGGSLTLVEKGEQECSYASTRTPIFLCSYVSSLFMQHKHDLQVSTHQLSTECATSKSADTILKIGTPHL